MTMLPGLPAPSTRLWPAIAAALVILASSTPSPAVAGSKAEPKADPYGRHIERLRARLKTLAPDTRFHILAAPPFVVVGDGARAAVQRRARHTVKWAIDRLKSAYFDRDPDRILTIYLFEGERSYRKHTRSLFGDNPDTPYGYYSPADGALIMNIATGGGTLVHELVHPLVEANFPAAPAWLNEGLGSLYEASDERDGQIVGLVNWRLPGLQAAIARGSLGSFKELLATTTDEFYDDDRGTNYAQARYLLYYLQEQGLLHRYYRQFYRDRAVDPTGYQTLQAILGRRDMDRFQREWERWISRLRWRR